MLQWKTFVTEKYFRKGILSFRKHQMGTEKLLTEMMLQKHLSFNVLFSFPKQLNSLAFNLL